MTQRLYTEDHEWVELDGNVATVGISSHAVEELGEIVYVELPETDDEINKGDEFGSVESVKTVSGLYSPLSGRVAEKNQTVLDTPELINQSPYENGWLIKVQVETNDEFDELMDEDSYQSFLSTL